MANAPTITIEKGVPLPGAIRGSGVSAYLHALAAAEVGDSVLIPSSLSKSTGRQLTSNVSAQANRILGTRCFRIKSEPDGVRVWKAA